MLEMHVRTFEVALLAMLSCAAPIPSLAEPSPTVQYLMDEPASLFDLGMKSLNYSLSEGMKDVDVFAGYSWEENRIEITVYDVEVPDTIPNEKARCAKLVEQVKRHLAVVNGKTPMKISGLGIYFSHTGYKNTKQPKNVATDLDAITTIRVHVSQAKDVTCESPLLSTKVMYSEGR